MEEDDTETTERDPLATQVGGDHYKEFAIQPVEFIHANKLGYIEGCIIKYVCRFRQKGGAKDLQKAMHYLEILGKLEYKDQVQGSFFLGQKERIEGLNKDLECLSERINESDAEIMTLKLKCRGAETAIHREEEGERHRHRLAAENNRLLKCTEEMEEKLKTLQRQLDEVGRDNEKLRRGIMVHIRVPSKNPKPFGGFCGKDDPSFPKDPPPQESIDDPSD